MEIKFLKLHIHKMNNKNEKGQSGKEGFAKAKFLFLLLQKFRNNFFSRLPIAEIIALLTCWLFFYFCKNFLRVGASNYVPIVVQSLNPLGLGAKSNARFP